MKLTSSGNDNFAPTWSADGRFVYFTSKRTGQLETWKIPSSGGPEVQVTRKGSIFAQESMDGHSLYYGRFNGGVFPIFRSRLDGSDETKILDTQACFVVVQKGLYFYGPSESTLVLEFLNFSTGSIRRIAPMPTTKLDQVGRMTISPDEQWVVYGHEDGTSNDLVLVKNFR